MLDLEQKRRIRTGFARFREDDTTFTRNFYLRLFDMAPEVRPLFREDVTAQAAKLHKALVVLVNSIDHLDDLTPALMDLGARHAGYGAQEGHYDVIGEALLRTLAGHIPDWTEVDVIAWSELLRQTTEAMIAGARAAPGRLRVSA